MVKQAAYTYTKLNQDTSRSKHVPEIYYEGKNIRVLTNEAFGSVTNQLGNTLKVEMPDITENPTTTKTHLNMLPYPLSDPKIVGSASIGNELYLLSSYPALNDEAKLFYAQIQSGFGNEPYIDGNLRVDVNGVTIFEDFIDTLGPVEGPNLPVGSLVRFTGFNFATEPNEPAPLPTLFLEIYEDGIMIDRQSADLTGYVNTVDLIYEFTTEPNKIYFAYSYTTADGSTRPNPFTNIDIYDYIVRGDIFTIHKVDKDYNVTLKFIDIYDVGDKKLDVQGFYENQNNQKLYWANGVDPLSYINIADPLSLELDVKFLSTVPLVQLSQPTITGFTSGGSHTSGSIQYGYNLYKVNGAQTKISPLSTIAYLNNGDRGNNVNVKVDKVVKLSIEDIDTSFDRIRVYSIKYSSLNSTPEIKLINEQSVPDSGTIELIDDNNSTINIVTFSEFVFLGGDLYIPKHLMIKDNRLFLANYKTRNYDIDFDARAYRYDINGNTIIKSKDGLTTYTFNKNTIPTIPADFDAINTTNKSIESDADWNKYIWKEVPTIPPTLSIPKLGGIGPNVAFEIKYNSVLSNFGQPTMISSPSLATVSNASDYTSLKSGETYRMFIDFLMDDGSFTFPKWVADVKIPEIGTVLSKPPVETDPKIIPEPLAYREVLLSNPPGSPTTGNACGITTGLTKYIDSSFAITNGLRIYNDIALTIPTYTNNPYTVAHYAMLYDVNNGLRYAVTFDGTGLIDTVTACGGGGSGSGYDEVVYINYCYIETELLNIPSDPRVVGWRTSIVERSEFDKTVITQGLYNPAIEDNYQPGSNNYINSYFQRTVRNSADIPDFSSGTDQAKPQRFNTIDSTELNLSTNNSSASNKTKGEITSTTNNYKISNTVGNIYTPETVLNKNNLGTASARIRKLGLLKNTFSYSNRQVFDKSGELTDIAFATRESTGVGASVLMGLSASTEANRIKTSKFISDNKNSANTELFARRRHAYVRYFGGLQYVREDFGANNNMSIAGKTSYIAPIQNVYSIVNPDDSSTVNFYASTTIPVLYETDLASGVVYKAFGGSSLAVVGLPAAFVTDYPELDVLDTNDFGVLVELYRIVQNQYGGDTYNARQLNRTIPYSNVRPLVAGTKTTEHTGDTFIQKFNFLKTFRIDNDIIQSSEIVSFPVETSINLDLRWDILKNRPDNFEADENTSYGFNLVYNQQNSTIKGIPKPFNFQELNEFSVNIIPSKLKIAGELIDSFTDFLVNDVKTLDGKYGEITGLGEHSDQVYSFQRDGIAYLSINPRVQISGSDGIQVELGAGGIIETYQYVTTNSGTLNKWSIHKTKNGLMYFDLLNKSINFIADQELSTVSGLYNKLQSYVNLYKDELELDHILNNKGVHTFYDSETEDIYFTFLSELESFTIAYNGLAQGFTSYYDFLPTNYFTYRNRMLTTKNNQSLWKHNEGLYQTFYGVYYPCSITLVLNPEPHTNKVFNNIRFQGETYINGVDVPTKTFNKIRVWNEYQDTGLVDLIPNGRPLIKRKFRNWNSVIPRVQNGRDRIHNAWVFLKLELDESDLNFKIVLHDLIVSYL